jgi:uncharacterized membrane protein YfcA
MESKPAVATSLFIITLISLFSIANKVSEVTLDFKLIIIFLLGSVIGMIIGGVIAQKISNSTSQRIFALVAFIIGVYMVFDSMFNL